MIIQYVWPHFFWDIFNFSFFHAFKMWRLNVFNLPGVTVFCVEPHITSHRIFRRRHAARRTSLHFVSLVAWVGGLGLFPQFKSQHGMTTNFKIWGGCHSRVKKFSESGGSRYFSSKNMTFLQTAMQWCWKSTWNDTTKINLQIWGGCHSRIKKFS